MNQEQALNILVQAVTVAQSKGVFNLKEAELVSQAVSVFLPKEEEKEESEDVTEEVK